MKNLNLKAFLRDLLIGAAVAALVFGLGLYREYSLMRCFCDGFFVVAVFQIGVGVIVLARNKGSFDAVGFGLRSVLQTHFPSFGKGEKEDIMAYRERKALSRKSAMPLILSGLVYLALSLIFLALYYRFP